MNCIDKGLLALHSKNERMVAHCIVTIDGDVSPVELKSAVLTVLLRHPTLRSTIRTGILQQVRQEKSGYADDILSVWDLALPQHPNRVNQSKISSWHKKRLSEWLNRPLNPALELPCRVLLVRRTLGGFSLVFTCHHSAADGLHLFRFAAEVIREYNTATGSASSLTYTLGDGKRGEPVALARACRSNVSHFYLKIAASLFHRFVLAPFSANARICRKSSGRSPEIDFCVGSLNPHEVRRIRSMSKSAGATLNDVLLSACFRTVQQWNDVHQKPSREISVMVPVDIGGASPSLVTANQVSFISVSTTRKERNDPNELLRVVRQRTSYLLENGIAFSIVYATSFCSLVSTRILKCVADFLMITRIYLDSILLTNLGLIWPKGVPQVEGNNIGTARITSVVGIPPVVSPMGISLCAGTYHDHLYFSLTYKSCQFSEAQAKTFLSLYLNELRGYQRTPEGLLATEVIQRDTQETATVK